MKMRNYFFAAALVVLAASCVKENAPESSEKATVNYVPMEFTSSVETKTVLADGKVNWLEGDKISIFDNSAITSGMMSIFLCGTGAPTQATLIISSSTIGVLSIVLNTPGSTLFTTQTFSVGLPVMRMMPFLVVSV